ncbi:JAB1/Mov34/MPN/PAD-1 ubiquitin protease-domain-containing protein [Diplogelasinospora grovesii]|uniref:COP9 signalosome complex subunit 5 n=1 Tax=Diplogelasinospora grovesii TaxID=303347 RepID=A0AAN6N6Y6_9PEZI|nr:JAB1/Mov34/MPN/PAD-1 ubiquitin protease-domain-containing protein [Diplogelasinospora grovesii]
MELPITDRLSDPARDSLYSYNSETQKALTTGPASSKPWMKDPNYFRSVRISSIALVKMVMHARSGGNLEVMGLMQGYVDGTTIVVTDSFRLPVEGTETRVNAQDDANEYMVQYLTCCREESRQENVVGWYHSHPGYGCWLSGIDVGTQHTQQQFNDPFVAVVVDPDRTVSRGMVDIGAFRTYPENYTAKTEGGGGTGGAVKGGGGGGATDAEGYESVPLAKVEDFGAHSSRYYSLEVEHFKSTLDTKLLDLLWNKYWVQTLAQNPLLSNREYGTQMIGDVATRLADAATGLEHAGKQATSDLLIAGYGGGGLTGDGATKGGAGGGGGQLPVIPQQTPQSKALDNTFEKITRDVKQVAAKEKAGLMATEVKVSIFGGGGDGSSSTPAGDEEMNTS